MWVVCGFVKKKKRLYKYKTNSPHMARRKRQTIRIFKENGHECLLTFSSQATGLQFGIHKDVRFLHNNLSFLPIVYSLSMWLMA
jgi:hypothetical protein